MSLPWKRKSSNSFLIEVPNRHIGHTDVEFIPEVPSAEILSRDPCLPSALVKTASNHMLSESEAGESASHVSIALKAQPYQETYKL